MLDSGESTHAMFLMPMPAAPADPRAWRSNNPLRSAVVPETFRRQSGLWRFEKMVCRSTLLMFRELRDRRNDIPPEGARAGRASRNPRTPHALRLNPDHPMGHAIADFGVTKNIDPVFLITRKDFLS